MVLNSLVNLNGAFQEIKKYGQVELFLDRDKAGKEAARNLMDTLPQCVDQSGLFLPYKDLNEYWMNREKLGVKR